MIGFAVGVRRPNATYTFMAKKSTAFFVAWPQIVRNPGKGAED